MASGASGLAPARRAQEGRPSGLERIAPAVRAEILARIRKGAPFSRACVSCGVPYRTFQRWCEFGRREDAREPYRSFALAVDREFAAWVVDKVEQMDDFSAKDWRAALEMLKRRDPENFSDPDRGGSTVNVQVVIEAERRDLSARMLAAAEEVLGADPELLERFAQALRAGAGGEVVEGRAVRELPEAAG